MAYDFIVTNKMLLLSLVKSTPDAIVSNKLMRVLKNNWCAAAVTLQTSSINDKYFVVYKSTITCHTWVKVYIF